MIRSFQIFRDLLNWPMVVFKLNWGGNCNTLYEKRERVILTPLGTKGDVTSITKRPKKTKIVILNIEKEGTIQVTNIEFIFIFRSSASL